MQTDNNLAHLRKWLRGCSALSGKNRFRIDFLAEEPTEYSLFAVPSAINYRENVLGELIPEDKQTLDFIFASREFYGADEQQNLENYSFFQDVLAWMIDQNAIRNLPNVDGGRTLSLVPTLTQFVSQADANSAQYQIQIKLTYRRL